MAGAMVFPRVAAMAGLWDDEMVESLAAWTEHTRVILMDEQLVYSMADGKDGKMAAMKEEMSVASLVA